MSAIAIPRRASATASSSGRAQPSARNFAAASRADLAPAAALPAAQGRAVGPVAFRPANALAEVQEPASARASAAAPLNVPAVAYSSGPEAVASEIARAVPSAASIADRLSSEKARADASR